LAITDFSNEQEFEDIAHYGLLGRLDQINYMFLPSNIQAFIKEWFPAFADISYKPILAGISFFT